MRREKKWLILAGLLLSLAGLQGCALVVGAAAGAAGVAYVKGEAEKTYDAPVERVYNAALTAVKDDLGLIVYESHFVGLEGEIKARRLDDKKVDIDLEAITERTTKVKIRVGTWGDEEYSRLIFSKIDKRL
ncbi:MAG: hypothetical protein AMS15_07170 [Planctomycetes bacterium DG_23]|nr:MAG: hypothetical protein AMS15_07170 [Planctomycetes bacterium DG_23]